MHDLRAVHYHLTQAGEWHAADSSARSVARILPVIDWSDDLHALACGQLASGRLGEDRQAA